MNYSLISVCLGFFVTQMWMLFIEQLYFTHRNYCQFFCFHKVIISAFITVRFTTLSCVLPLCSLPSSLQLVYIVVSLYTHVFIGRAKITTCPNWDVFFSFST